ncbi:hypothetical protein LguiA_007034 [Lonicera macranthoides]
METEDQTLVQDCNPENLDPSPVQDEYAPVIFSQETEDRENILRARASGKGVLTYPFKLLKSNHLGGVLTFAINNTNLPPDATLEQCINATIGYMLMDTNLDANQLDYAETVHASGKALISLINEVLD